MFHVIQWQQIMESKSGVSVSFTAFLTPLISQQYRNGFRLEFTNTMDVVYLLPRIWADLLKGIRDGKNNKNAYGR